MATSNPQSGLRVPFGSKSGRLVAPDEVDSGRACACECPGCGTPLIARKGEKNIWHFAHGGGVPPTQACVESAIHAAAKQVLVQEAWLRVPAKVVKESGVTKYGAVVTKQEELSPARVIRFDYCKEEVWESAYGVRPDVVGYRGEKRLLVEMYFTHRVDDIKKQKLVSLGVPAIEIDLSDIEFDAGFKSLRVRVLENVAEKSWLCYPREVEVRKVLREQVALEITRLEKAHEEEVAERKRREDERKKAKEEQRKARLSEDPVSRQIDEANSRYRALSQSQKEEKLRKELGFSEDWPYYLNKTFPGAAAIKELPHIWQGEVFLRFIFQMRKRSPTFKLRTVISWVIARFGIEEDKGATASIAVTRFLRYLRGCKFLSESRGVSKGIEFTVCNDGLEPPPRDALPTTVRLPEKAASDVELIGNKRRIWLWKSTDPDLFEVVSSARTKLPDSPYKEQLIEALGSLTRATRPEYPADFAAKLELAGVPFKETEDALVKFGFALNPKYAQ